MEGFKTFTQSVDLASQNCSRWKSAADGTLFSWRDLMDLAASLDMDYSLAPYQWYLVFPDGEIAILSEETGMIDRVFLPDNQTGVSRSEVNAAEVSDEIAALYDREGAPAPARNFCIHCGAPLDPEGSFCSNCGKKVKGK